MAEGAEPDKENRFVSSASAPPAIPLAGSRPVIAGTKLHIPRTRPDAIRRAQLVGELVDSAPSRLTLVAAPAGSGKTSLLAEWHSDPREQRPFAWISLDAGDNDPVRFWDGVIAALQTVDPVLGANAESGAAQPGNDHRRAHAAAVDQRAERSR